MSRTARLTDALHGRGALLFAGTAAALIGAGGAAAASASAATTAAPALSAPASAQAPALTGTGGSDSIVTTAAVRHTPAGHAAPAASRTRPRRAAAHPGHGPARPYEMYDSVTPSAIPGGKAVATYADGPYAAAPSQVAGRPSVTWIDTNGSDPKGASVLDVEPGDATPQMAATWAGQRLDDHPHGQAVIYTMLSDWTATKDAIAGLPGWQQHQVRYWIADPTGTPHLVPGSSATQWYWGTSYDISTVTPGF
jgi:hypothetical protein